MAIDFDDLPPPESEKLIPGWSQLTDGVGGLLSLCREPSSAERASSVVGNMVLAMATIVSNMADGRPGSWAVTIGETQLLQEMAFHKKCLKAALAGKWISRDEATGAKRFEY